jgi:hypothetical protein
MSRKRKGYCQYLQLQRFRSRAGSLDRQEVMWHLAKLTVGSRYATRYLHACMARSF